MNSRCCRADRTKYNQRLVAFSLAGSIRGRRMLKGCEYRAGSGDKKLPVLPLPNWRADGHWLDGSGVPTRSRRADHSTIRRPCWAAGAPGSSQDKGGGVRGYGCLYAVGLGVSTGTRQARQRLMELACGAEKQAAGKMRYRAALGSRAACMTPTTALITMTDVAIRERPARTTGSSRP